MTKPKGVKFQHRNTHDRRQSASTTSSESSTASANSNIEVDKPKNGIIIKGENTIVEPSDYEKKRQTFITRTVWTIGMIAGFFIIMFSGHIYILMLITAIQIVSFKEVIAIAEVPIKAKNLPLTRSLNWYFLAITMYYLYGETVIYYFKHILLVDKVLLPLATHHRFISFMMYILGKTGTQTAASLLTVNQDLFSLSALSKKVTTSFSSRSSLGHIWRYI